LVQADAVPPFLVQADAVPPYFFGATASAGTKKSSALQRAPVQKNLIRRYSERRYKNNQTLTAIRIENCKLEQNGL